MCNSLLYSKGQFQNSHIRRGQCRTMIVKNVIVNLFFTPLVVLPLSAGISFVQQNNTTSYPSGSSMAVAYPAAQTAGNLNIGVVGWNDTSAAVKSITRSEEHTS